jgi:hypothetical protein
MIEMSEMGEISEVAGMFVRNEVLHLSQFSHLRHLPIYLAASLLLTSAQLMTFQNALM